MNDDIKFEVDQRIRLNYSGESIPWCGECATIKKIDKDGFVWMKVDNHEGLQGLFPSMVERGLK